jgi:hypothetical protein
VPGYINNPSSEYYHGRLYSYQATYWRTGKQPVRCVYFGPISREEDCPLSQEAGEPEHLPRFCVLSQALKQSDTEEHGAALVGMGVFEVVLLKTKNETNAWWNEAIDRCWSTWQGMRRPRETYQG